MARITVRNARRVPSFRVKASNILNQNHFYDIESVCRKHASQYSFMAMSGRTSVGTVIAVPDSFRGSPVMYVSYLCVRPSWHRRRVGTLLLLRLVREWNLHMDLMLHCWDLDLVHYYTRFGFSVRECDTVRGCTRFAMIRPRLTSLV